MRTKILFAALLLFASIRPAFAQESLTLKGAVTGPGDTVVEGAVLRLYRIAMEGQAQMNYRISPIAETKSDAKGQFTFVVENQQTASPAYYTCIGHKEGLSYGWRTLLQDGQDLNISLTEPQKMIGFVQEPDGKAVAGAEVRLAILSMKGDDSNFTLGLEPVDCFVSKTCDQGRFEFNALPEGSSAEILVKKDGKGVLHTLKADVSPENGLTYQAGQTEIMLTVQKPCTISGVVLARQGSRPVEGISVSAVQENMPVNLLDIKPAVSAADGTFQVSQLPPGKYTLIIDSPDWIAAPLSLNVQGNVGTKIELQKGGVLEVKVLDGSMRQPLDKASVSIRNKDNGQSYSCITDSSGIAKKQLSPGNYEVYAHHMDFQGAQNAAVAVVESEKTIGIEIGLSGRQKLTGIVKGLDEKPAKDVIIRMMPNNGMPTNTKTDAEGRFSIAWNPQEMSWTQGQFYLLAIDKENNLAKAESIDTETREVTLTLAKGASIKGKVLNEAGKPIKDARASLTFWGERWGSSFDSEEKTNADGEYVFKGLPAEHKYSVNIYSVKGYGSGSSPQFVTESPDEPVTLEDIVLRVADQKLSGRVVDVEGKGLADVRVSLNGEGQPGDSVSTDKEGKFKFEQVCAGPLSLYANFNVSNQYMYGNVRTEGGAEDVTIVLSSQGGYARPEPKKPASLVGKSLPDLSTYGVEVPADANSVLVFVWDMQQRPSRHFVLELAARQQQLADKGVKVVLLNASKIEKEPMQKWLAENKVPFVCGIMSVDPENAAFNLGVQGLPWLILTDNEETVIEEGFSIDDLDKEINSI